MEIFSKSLTTLERAMDLRTHNQSIIASNLANIDTPGYAAQKLDFQASMELAMQDAKDAAVIAPSGDPVRSLDGNNVDLEGELSQMTQNRMLYSVTSQLMGAKFRQLSNLFDQEA